MHFGCNIPINSLLTPTSMMLRNNVDIYVTIKRLEGQLAVCRELQVVVIETVALFTQSSLFDATLIQEGVGTSGTSRV